MITPTKGVRPGRSLLYPGGQILVDLDEPSTVSGAWEALAELYAAADVQLPDVAFAAYDDVQAYHDSVIANRRQYLDAEIRRITTDLNTNTTERDRLAAQRSDSLRLLASGGAAETLLELQRDAAKRQVASSTSATATTTPSRSNQSRANSALNANGSPPP